MCKAEPISSQVPGFGKKISDRTLLDALLNTEFIIQVVIGNRIGRAIEVINADAVAVAIGADQADFEIFGNDFAQSSGSSC